MKKTFKIVKIVLISLFAAVSIFLLLPLLPLQKNYKVKVVESGSMSPAIRRGSAVVIWASDAYKAGDIITFGKENGPIPPTTHRIVDIKPGMGRIIYVTKGDANESADVKDVFLSDIIGKVVFSIPLLGYLVNFIKSPYGFFIIILFPALLIIIDELEGIAAEIKKFKYAKSKAKKGKSEKGAAEEGEKAGEESKKK